MLFVVLLPAAVFFFLSGQKMVCLAVRVQTKVQTKVQRKVQTKVGKIRRAAFTSDVDGTDTSLTWTIHSAKVYSLEQQLDDLNIVVLNHSKEAGNPIQLNSTQFTSYEQRVNPLISLPLNIHPHLSHFARNHESYY